MAKCALLTLATFTPGEVAWRRVVMVDGAQLLAIPHLFSFTLILPASVRPFVGAGATDIASSPVLILLEACAPFVFAASGIHAIVSILDARQLLAIPDRFVCLHPDIGILIPQIVRRACGIATCPMLVLQVAMTLGVLACFGLHAIPPVVCGRENMAVPDVLLLFRPSAVFPLHLILACLVATCPILVLLEAMTVVSHTRLRVHAILPVMRGRELVTIPDVLLLANPPVILPHHIAVTSLIASGPMLILSPTPALLVVTTQGLTAILSTVGALSLGCPDDITHSNGRSSPRCLASDRQQDHRPKGRGEAHHPTAGRARLSVQ